MMNKTKPVSAIVLLLLACPFALLSQDEFILPLKSNQVIKAAILQENSSGSHSRMQSNVTDTLFLPFFDDFSEFTVWPSASRWLDSAAFVNPNFGINPPTVGVATFDGLNSKGNPYNSTNANASGLCDVLTSKAINLFEDENGLPYNTSDSINLIFYYQRKGRGDNPESNDSLQLQFYNPVSQEWVRVWSVTGITGGDTVFTKVKISVNDPDFRQNGFSFRFRNFGSQTGLLDIWNIDYVFLNKFLPPDYDTIRDYAFVYEGTSLLNNHSAVPWKHYKSLSQGQQQAFVKSSAQLTLRNNNDASTFPISVAGTVYDQYNNPTQIVGGAGTNNIVIPLNTNVVPPTTLLANDFFQDPTPGNKAVFTAVYEIGQASGGVVDDFPVNDTLRYIQNFHDYYSYDDGSAELAYGVSGAGAQLAYKFDILKSDTLRAVHIFFAQSGLNVSNQPFRLCVWSGGGSGPTGPPIYEKFNQTPNYVDSINGFYTYTTDPLPLAAGTYFFGFIQTNATLLNLGLDVNTPADNSRKFINTTGSWVNSQLPGMWMIRPVLNEEPLTTAVNSPVAFNHIQVYPVPATDVLNIRMAVADETQIKIVVSDITGRTLLNFESFVSRINVSDFLPGFYMLHFYDVNSGEVTGKKFIVSGN
jgi:hypothetical protein